MEELDEEEQAKIHELMFNQEQKLKGLPTSDQMVGIMLLYVSSIFKYQYVKVYDLELVKFYIQSPETNRSDEEGMGC